MIDLPSISIIGLGNLGWNLALKLSNSGVKIDRIVAEENAFNSNFAAELGANLLNNTDALEENDLVLACVRDNQIIPLIEQTKERRLSIVHTSGGVALPKASEGSQTGVFYPFQTFTHGFEANWDQVPICIESNSKALIGLLTQLADAMSCKALELNSEEREKLHVAGVIGSNFTNHLIQNIQALLDHSELDMSLTKPLIQETIRKSFALSPKTAQTGPAIRNDRGTIETHLKLLEAYPEIRQVYLHLTKSIQQSNS